MIRVSAERTRSGSDPSTPHTHHARHLPMRPLPTCSTREEHRERDHMGGEWGVGLATSLSWLASQGPASPRAARSAPSSSNFGFFVAPSGDSASSPAGLRVRVSESTLTRVWVTIHVRV